MLAGQHPDIEHLDAYADGDLAGVSGVDLHIRSCPQCRETVTALRQVRDDLAALASVTMPDDVVARLHAALRSERDSLDRAAGPTPLSRSLSRSRSPGRIRGRRPGNARSSRPPRVPVWFSAAAACLIVVLGIIGLMGVLTLRPSRNTAGEATSRLAAPLAANTAGPLDERAETGAGIDATPNTGPGAAPGAADDSAAALPVLAHTGHALDTADVPRHVHALLSGQFADIARVPLGLGLASSDGTSNGTAGSSATAMSVAVAELTRPDLRMCYLSLSAQTDGAIVALDLVGFHGQRAVLVVLSVHNDPGELRAIVLDEGCGVTNMAAAQWYSTTMSRQ